MAASPVALSTHALTCSPSTTPTTSFEILILFLRKNGDCSRGRIVTLLPEEARRRFIKSTGADCGVSLSRGNSAGGFGTSAVNLSEPADRENGAIVTDKNKAATSLGEFIILPFDFRPI